MGLISVDGLLHRIQAQNPSTPALSGLCTDGYSHTPCFHSKSMTMFWPRLVCNSAANPLCFIDVSGGVFRAVTITTAIEPPAGWQIFWMSATEAEGVSQQMGLARAVGDEE